MKGNSARKVEKYLFFIFTLLLAKIMVWTDRCRRIPSSTLGRPFLLFTHLRKNVAYVDSVRRLETVVFSSSPIDSKEELGRKRGRREKLVKLLKKKLAIQRGLEKKHVSSSMAIDRRKEKEKKNNERREKLVNAIRGI